MEDVNLCETCKTAPGCLMEGIFGRQVCEEYDPLSLIELLERDQFVRSIMVGPCPKCGSDNTYDCECNPLLEDNTVGHCLDCDTYWCLERRHLLKVVERRSCCPHWEICAECSGEHGYLPPSEFVEEICPACEHYAEGCQLEDPFQCEKLVEFTCPYDGNIEECPRIQELV